MTSWTRQKRRGSCAVANRTSGTWSAKGGSTPNGSVAVGSSTGRTSSGSGRAALGDAAIGALR
nr:hypothetical protein [Rhodococcus sp. 06-221-2]